MNFYLNHGCLSLVFCTFFIFSGRGCVVGILKVGRKRLFVYDSHGVQQELEPLCVLDFYVHESRQRRGYGRKLFDYMLQVQQSVRTFCHFMGALHLIVVASSRMFRKSWISILCIIFACLQKVYFSVSFAFRINPFNHNI